MADIRDVEAVQIQNGPLHVRMDVDRSLYYLRPYVMHDSNGKTVPGILNLTLNIPATFAAHVHASLMGAEQQVKVTSQDMDEDEAKEIEDFIEAAIESADARLRLRGEPTVRPFATEQVNIRGRTAFRVTIRPSGSANKPTIDILPVDTRYASYEFGDEGLLWFAYKTWRSPRMIKSEYPEFDINNALFSANKQGEGTAALLEVTDLWDMDTNRVYVGGKLIRTRDNRYGRPPFVFEVVPMGSMLQDEDRISHRGESIFFLIRDLIEQTNLMASVLQTLNVTMVKAARTWHSAEGTQAEVPEGLGDIGTDTAADIDGGAKLVPQGDVNQAGQLLQTILSRAIQQGSLSSSDFGNLQFPLSAVALVKLGESSGQVFLPRLGTKGLIMQQMAYMIIEQLLALGVPTIKLGQRGHERTFQTASLKGDYSIEYLYTLKSPETDVALYSIAQVALQFFGIETVLSDVLKVKNPAETRRLKRLDDAELISPNIMRYRTALALIEEEREVEAQILADEMGATIEQLTSGEFEGALLPAPQPGNPNDIAPLLDTGTKAQSNKRASQLGGVAGGQEGRAR